MHCRNRTYVNFKLKLCTCAQSNAFCTSTKLRLEILTINVIFGIVYFRKIISESLRSVSETTPTGPWFNIKMPSYQYRKSHCLDKTVVRSSYLHNGISYSGKTVLCEFQAEIFQLVILTINVISGIVYFREIILESLRSVSETTPGPLFNMKMPSYQYRKSHCLDKTAVKSSYLHNGISYSGKTVYCFIESVPWSVVHCRISVRNSS